MRHKSATLVRHQNHGVLPRQWQVYRLSFRISRVQIQLLKWDGGQMRALLNHPLVQPVDPPQQLTERFHRAS